MGRYAELSSYFAPLKIACRFKNHSTAIRFHHYSNYFAPSILQRMNTRFFFGFLGLFLSFQTLSQEAQEYKSNFFGISFDVGGGLQLDESKTTSGSVTPTKNPNIGTSLFWEHHVFAHKKRGFIFGGGINWMTFTNSVNYEYKKNGGPQPESIQDNLGKGFRSNVISIDLPIYYTYRLNSKIGAFSPYFGVNVRTVAALINQEGYTGLTTDIDYQGQVYYSDYEYSFDLSRVAPMIQPTLGLSYVGKLKNGASLKYSIDYKISLDVFSYVSLRYQNSFRSKGGYVITPNGLEPVEYITVDVSTDYLKVNMSRFSFGVAYGF